MPLTSWSDLAFVFFVFLILLCWRLSEKDYEFSVFSFFLCHKQWGTQSGCIISFVLFTLKYKNRCLFLQGFHLLACMAYMLSPHAAWC